MSEPIRAKQYDVFISYKREDDAARDVLITALEDLGYEVAWDAKLMIDYWRPSLRDLINRSKLKIVLWSAKAATSDEVKDEASAAKQLERCLSVPIESASVVPGPYADLNLNPFDKWADETARASQLEKILDTVECFTGGPSRIPPKPATETIPVELSDGFPAAPTKLIGRDAEMQLLRDAWAGGTNAVVLHALGGAGKSALLRTFLNELLENGGEGAARVYGWSAYSQGSGEQKRADADSFIAAALDWFGYVGPPIKDGVERARTLARLIQLERSLLLLDGLEPLQDPPDVNKGRLKDRPLATLIKTLGNQNPGLMIITSRQPVFELEGMGGLALDKPLDELSEQAGAELLVELGVTGRQHELEAAVREVRGHALSVTLLGTFIAEVCGGDIKQRDRFKFGEIIDTAEELDNADKTVIAAKRAEKVMAGYLERFDELSRQAAGLGGAERVLLHLLGLFDRPADGDAVDLLLSEHIPGLTDALFFEQVEKRKGPLGLFKAAQLREITPCERTARLREAKARLRKLKLLAKPDQQDPRGLDAHPIVRAWFATRLAETAPEAARAAHDKLYHHYAAAAPDLPDTLEEMEPLFHAIGHGVKAGRVQEALDEVFYRRIRRGNEHYITRVHGAFGANLAAIAQFFTAPWTTPHPGLRPADQAWLLNSAAFALAALARLRESLAPREAGLAADIAREDWIDAAVAGGTLSNTLLTLGDVPRAIAAAETALSHAETSGDDEQREFGRCSVAAALTAAGDLDRAATLFAEAEGIDPNQPQLISLQGYQYGDLLLALGSAEEALARGRYQLDIAQAYLGRGFGLHNIGFGWLLIGRALDAALGNHNAEAAEALDNAVDGLRKAGTEQFLPQALLARAAQRRRRVAAGETALLEPLRADLAEIADIAEPEMRLCLTDLALERARLALDVPASVDGDARAEAARQTEIAAELIATTGYHRRDGELADLCARLADA